VNQQPTVIPYRTPLAGGVREQRVLNELIKSETLGWAAVAGKIALGLPPCLFGPLVVAAVAKIVESKWEANVLPGFLATWLLLTAVLLPLLMALERRTRGEFLSDAVRGETSPLAASSYGEYQLQSARFLGTAYTELALLGPRLLWDVIDWMRRRPASDTDLRATAAAIVVELLDAGQGLVVRQLVRPDRPPADVLRAIQYLLSRDWIGTSKARDRVWLLSPTRDRLSRG
jgi:hypothetical protein